jgi:hypothetical protein
MKDLHCKNKKETYGNKMERFIEQRTKNIGMI